MAPPWGTGSLLCNEPGTLRTHWKMVDQWTGGPPTRSAQGCEGAEVALHGRGLGTHRPFPVANGSLVGLSGRCRPSLRIRPGGGRYIEQCACAGRDRCDGRPAIDPLGSAAAPVAAAALFPSELAQRHVGVPLESAKPAPRARPHLACDTELLQQLRQRDFGQASPGAGTQKGFDGAVHGRAVRVWMRRAQCESLVSAVPGGRAAGQCPPRRDRMRQA